MNDYVSKEKIKQKLEAYKQFQTNNEYAEVIRVLKELLCE